MSPRISPRMNNIMKIKKSSEIKTKIREFQTYIKKIFNMLETILLTKPDQFIMKIRTKKLNLWECFFKRN